MNRGTEGGDTRLAALRQWLQQQPADLALAVDTLRPASADASFRRYFRIDAASRFGGSLIAMDAPPAREDCRRYVRIAALLRDADLHAPQIVADDLAQGFLLLTDLGQTTYLAALRATQGLPWCHPSHHQARRMS